MNFPCFSMILSSAA